MNSNNDNILFLDIETVPLVYHYKELNESAKGLWDKKWNYHKELSPEQQYAKAGIYAEFAKVVVIGMGYFTKGKFRLRTISSDIEVSLLTEFALVLSQHFNSDQHVLCAHNGREFDFPFLCRRFLINKIPLPATLRIQGKKPWEIKHIDTLDLWKFGDVKNYSSLSLLAHVFGIPSPKEDMDGSMVGKTYYEEKDLKKIENYCMKDVVTLARVYNRFAGAGDLHDEDVVFA
jgi:uncharacterized protein YprB with RNaseH-like and TPR domain